MSKNSSYKTEIYGLGRLAFKGQIYTLEYSKKKCQNMQLFGGHIEL